jgi:hypothetical protein
MGMSDGNRLLSAVNPRGYAIDKENYAGCGWYRARRLRCFHSTRIPDPLTHRHHYIVSKMRGCRDCASCPACFVVALRCCPGQNNSTVPVSFPLAPLRSPMSAHMAFDAWTRHVYCGLDITCPGVHRKDVSFLIQVLRFIYV